MTNLKKVVVAVALAAGIARCAGNKPPATGGETGNTIKLETWMDGISKNAEVDVSTMPDNVLYTVTDKQPVAAAEASAAAPEPGKVAVVYDDDPAKLRFLFEADPRFEAQ